MTLKITKFKSHYKNYFPVGEGWRPLVEKLVDDIIKIDKNVEIAQCKEKFAGLRFYIYGGNKEINDIIEEAEQKSYKICEKCGKPGRLRKNGWLKTLCDKCFPY